MAFPGDITYSALLKWADGIAKNDYDNMIKFSVRRCVNVMS